MGREPEFSPGPPGREVRPDGHGYTSRRLPRVDIPRSGRVPTLARELPSLLNPGGAGVDTIKRSRAKKKATPAPPLPALKCRVQSVCIILRNGLHYNNISQPPLVTCYKEGVVGPREEWLECIQAVAVTRPTLQAEVGHRRRCEPGTGMYLPGKGPRCSQPAREESCPDTTLPRAAAPNPPQITVRAAIIAVSPPPQDKKGRSLTSRDTSRTTSSAPKAAVCLHGEVTLAVSGGATCNLSEFQRSDREMRKKIDGVLSLSTMGVRNLVLLSGSSCEEGQLLLAQATGSVRQTRTCAKCSVDSDGRQPLNLQSLPINEVRPSHVSRLTMAYGHLWCSRRGWEGGGNVTKTMRGRTTEATTEVSKLAVISFLDDMSDNTWGMTTCVCRASAQTVYGSDLSKSVRRTLRAGGPCAPCMVSHCSLYGLTRADTLKGPARADFSSLLQLQTSAPGKVHRRDPHLGVLGPGKTGNFDNRVKRTPDDQSEGAERVWPGTRPALRMTDSGGSLAAPESPPNQPHPGHASRPFPAGQQFRPEEF
ncbi:hypothetical protein Bbelb_401990 [Branchiostoma belcheri]|nr:hypothetical protein Bbelb_401990 [Branchiostoma belcheri]